MEWLRVDLGYTYPTSDADRVIYQGDPHAIASQIVAKAQASGLGVMVEDRDLPRRRRSRRWRALLAQTQKAAIAAGVEVHLAHDVQPSVPEPIEGRCSNPACTRTVIHRRGLCVSCYFSLRREGRLPDAGTLDERRAASNYRARKRADAARASGPRGAVRGRRGRLLASDPHREKSA